MADVVIFELGKTPRYLRSVNTPDYTSNLNALINPDLSAVTGWAVKYWKRDGNKVVVMTPAERVLVDAAELQGRKDGIVLDYHWEGLLDVLKENAVAITEEELLVAIKAHVS